MVVSCRKLMIVLLVLVLSVLSASVDSPSSAASTPSSSSSSSSSPSSASSSSASSHTLSSSSSSSSGTETSSATVATPVLDVPSTPSERRLADPAPPSPATTTTTTLPNTASTVSRDASSSLPQDTDSIRATSSTVTSHPPSTSSPSKTAPKRGSAGFSRKGQPVKDKRVLKALEKSLLGSLGLKSRPRPKSVASVPPYMLQLYRRQANSQSPLNTIDSPFLQVKGRGGIAANTVRSFHHTDHHVDTGCDPRTCHRLIFNVTNIPTTEVVAAAELRIFLGLNPNKQGHQGAEVKSAPCEGLKESECAEAADSDSTRGAQHQPQRERYRLEVHEIMQPVGGDSDEDCISRLIDTRHVEPGDVASWESFDIQPAVLKWKRGPRHNHGLEIRLFSASPSVSTSRHVRLRRAADLSEDQWRVERPLLVTYTDDGRGPKSKSLRSKRSANSDRKRRRRKSREGKTRRNRRNKKKKKKKKRRKTKKGDKNMCRRHPLYVDFSDVGWNDWIVAPDGYNAYYCQGDCNFPLAHHLNSTNHAIVQTLVNSVDPSAVPKACCVPTELSAISMLYLDEWDKVVLKNYQDMVVEACGCR